MLDLGNKVRFLDNEVTILVCFENEVLIFIDQHTIKWVDKSLLEVPVTA